jgi:hypothetical protein
MMEELLIELARAAQREQAVASHTLENGMEMLVYPLSEGVLVGLGFSGELAQEVRMENALRKRSEDMPRYGAWQAALFSNGSCYVARRLKKVNLDSGEPILSADELTAGEELIT